MALREAVTGKPFKLLEATIGEIVIIPTLKASGYKPVFKI